jgi:hypothetical protein
LWEWEEELLGECRLLLSYVVLHDHTFNQWRWRLDPSGGYSVCGVYQMLTTDDSHTFSVTSDLIWHKVNLMAHGVIT